MITLIRWFILKSKETKYKLAFYTFLDKTIKELNTEEFKEKLLKEIMPYLAKVIHEQTHTGRKSE